MVDQSKPVVADVIVVGAGMVGLAFATALASSGVKIVILEQREGEISGFGQFVHDQQNKGYDPRVSALTCASQQILDSVGAWQIMQTYRVSPYTDMDVWDGEGTGHIHFSSRDLHEPSLGHIVENRVTLAGLYEAMQQHDNIQLITGAGVKALSWPENGVRTVTLTDGHEITASLVVASDGALSKTRQMAGIPMWEWDYGHHAIVTTVKTERPHLKTAWQRFTEDGPLALLPLSSDEGDCYCSIVWSTSPAHAKQLMELDTEAFNVALSQAFESRLGTVLWSDERFVFPLRQRHAKHYIQESFVAIGDAAHTIHPLAGQGVNLGLLDAAQLAETLLSAIQRGEALGDEQVLRMYQRIRRSENIQMSAAMEGFKQLFNSRQPVLQLARNMGMSLIDKIAPVKNHIVQQAMGLSGNLPAIARRPIKD